jgi:uncharacterized coiled-coil protein SlyX
MNAAAAAVSTAKTSMVLLRGAAAATTATTAFLRTNASAVLSSKEVEKAEQQGFKMQHMPGVDFSPNVHTWLCADLKRDIWVAAHETFSLESVTGKKEPIGFFVVACTLGDSKKCSKCAKTKYPNSKALQKVQDVLTACSSFVDLINRGPGFGVNLFAAALTTPVANTQGVFNVLEESYQQIVTLLVNPATSLLPGRMPPPGLSAEEKTRIQTMPITLEENRILHFCAKPECLNTQPKATRDSIVDGMPSGVQLCPNCWFGYDCRIGAELTESSLLVSGNQHLLFGDEIQAAEDAQRGMEATEQLDRAQEAIFEAVQGMDLEETRATDVSIRVVEEQAQKLVDAVCAIVGEDADVNAGFVAGAGAGSGAGAGAGAAAGSAGGAGAGAASSADAHKKPPRKKISADRRLVEDANNISKTLISAAFEPTREGRRRKTRAACAGVKGVAQRATQAAITRSEVSTARLEATLSSVNKSIASLNGTIDELNASIADPDAAPEKHAKAIEKVTDKTTEMQALKVNAAALSVAASQTSRARRDTKPIQRYGSD